MQQYNNKNNNNNNNNNNIINFDTELTVVLPANSEN